MGRSRLVESRASWPAMALSSRAQSSAVWPNAPGVSRLDAKAINPYREQMPYVGFKPQMPDSAAGWRIDPPVSVPVAAGTSRAATAAAEPPELPPATQVVFHGFLTGPKYEFSFDEPMANSSMLVLPRRTM